MVVPLSITAVISVVIGLYPDFFMNFVQSAVLLMNLVQLIEFLRNRLKTVVRVCFGVLALLVVLDAIPCFVDKEHAHTRPEHCPGFWSVFGFVGCVADHRPLQVVRPRGHHDSGRITTMK